jgi:hypothetical protein
MTATKIGICVDDWKLPIFERHLKQSGYTFENCGNFALGAILLRVDTTNPTALHEVVRAANTEAARTGKPT